MPDKPPRDPGQNAQAPPASPLVKHLWPRDQFYRAGDVILRIEPRAEEFLGQAGRLLSGSKSSYARAHPDHDVLFNACVFSAAGIQLWFGDLDLTVDAAKVQALADAVDQRLIVTPEYPYRFDGLPSREEWDERVRGFDPGGRR